MYCHYCVMDSIRAFKRPFCESETVMVHFQEDLAVRSLVVEAREPWS